MLKGLTSSDALERLTRYGLNVISDQKKKPFIVKFLEQFNNFLTILLLFAVFVSFFIGDSVDALFIAAIVILNAGFGLYQEIKAEASIEALRKMAVSRVRVIRDGQEQEIESEFVVPGDVLFIEEGSKISADGRLLESLNLEVNESILTGESFPVVKKNDDIVFSGTIVTKGRAHLQVTSTGMQTEFGKIAGKLSGIADLETPLQRKLKKVGQVIGVAGVVASIFVFIFSIITGAGYVGSFLLAVSLAVAVVPEGLQAVVTITLAIGVSEMAKRKSIVRKLSAIEAVGNITLIATDKTGTLTTNKMRVKELFFDRKLYEVNSLPSLSNKKLDELILDGILCSTASLVRARDSRDSSMLGDPTEGALLFMADRLGVEPERVRAEWKMIDEIPFNSVTKRMSVHVQNKDTGYSLIFVKGAPESIIPLCSISNEDKKLAEEQMDSWAKKGLRVLAFATQVKKNSTSSFLGMVAIHDEPRPEARDAVTKAKEAGIKVVMITGDNELTAEAIGSSIGIIDNHGDVMLGDQLEKYSDSELLQILPRVRIFARTSPFQKHRIVKLYQELGEIVAVTGDGVNDTIALKQADVGIAMGMMGTDVAREVADIVLTDDNFASILSAIEEGRNIIKNVKNAVIYLLASNIAEVISLIVGLLLGIPSLFYAIQLLYVNFVTDGLPALALSFSARDKNLMKKPSGKETQLLNKSELYYIGIVGLFSSVLVLISYYLFAHLGDIQLGKTAAFSVLSLIPSFLLMDVWLGHRPVLQNLKLLISPIFILAFSIPFVSQFLILSTPFLSFLFKVKPVRLEYIILFTLISSFILFGIKIKNHFRKLHY